MDETIDCCEVVKSILGVVTTGRLLADGKQSDSKAGLETNGRLATNGEGNGLHEVNGEALNGGRTAEEG